MGPGMRGYRMYGMHCFRGFPRWLPILIGVFLFITIFSVFKWFFFWIAAFMIVGFFVMPFLKRHAHQWHHQPYEGEKRKRREEMWFDFEEKRKNDDLPDEKPKRDDQGITYL